MIRQTGMCVLLLICGLPIAQAATITADSCSQEDVQAAIDQAQEGDTIMLPKCDVAWSTYVTISDKEITVRGNGIDNTIIKDDLPSHAYGEALFSVSSTEGKALRITGITFSGEDHITTYGLIYISGTSKNFRIDNCRFINLRGRSIRIQGYTYGVVDHCTWIVTADASLQGISIVGDGDDAWERPQELGSANAVYIEDCLFNYSYMNDGALDAYNGARYVFRYNKMVGTVIAHHGRDSGGFRSTHSFEIYDNIASTSYSVFTWFGARGGTGVIFDNNVSGNYNLFGYLTNYRSCLSYPPAGRCDGTSPYDGNTAGGQGYPCQDQIGRTTGQVLSPVYGWGNVYKGGNGKLIVRDQECNRMRTFHIIEGRDFFNNTPKPGYKPYIYPHPLTVAPFGADICGEGEITDECWCQGMKTKGYCMHGYYYKDGTDLEGYPTYDVNQDGDINIQDILLIVNVILGETSNSRAEVNGDESVNVQDVQEVANEMLR